VEHEMLKGFLYSELGGRDEINCDTFIEEMADYFNVEEISEQDVREAVADLIKEGYVLYGTMDKQIVATTPDHLTPSGASEEGDTTEQA